MTQKILQLVNPADSTADMLEVVDTLRKAIEAGEIKAFSAVGIQPDHQLLLWTARSAPTTHLEMLGACSRLLQHWHNETDV